MAITKHNDKLFIVDGIFAFAKLAEPSLKYQSVSDKEYSINVIVEKSVAKEWNKLFPKQKAKEFEPSEFEQKFKMEAPFGDDDVYVLNLKKPASKDGVAYDEKYRPKAIVRYEDGDVDITTSRLISNGSKGKASVRVNSNDFGTFAQLQAVFMLEEDFIEYTSAGSAAGSEFGAKVVKVEAENKAATQARATKESKPNTKQAPVEQDEDFEDSPF